MAAELATAYFSLLPSMKGTAGIVRSELAGVDVLAGAAGGRAGAALGGGVVASFSKFIPVIGGLLLGAGIIGGVSDLFSQSVDSASALNESANAVKVTFGDAAGEITKLGDTAANRLGLSKNQFNQLATQFSSFATTVAGDGGDVVKTLDELTTRGADFASVYNLDVNDALSLFQSGLAGETEPLRKFGIDLSAASVEAYAYANGIGTVGTELTEAQKVQARYGSLLEQTNKVQGDFSNTSDQLANSQRILQARFEDARAELGTALLPAVTKLTEVMLDKGVPVFEKLIDLFIKLEPAITATVVAVADIIGFFADLFLASVTLWDSLGDGKDALGDVATYLGLLPAPLQGAFIGFYNFVVGLANTAIDAANGIGTAFTNAVNSVSALTGVTAKFNKIARLGVLGLTTRTNTQVLTTGNNTNYGYATGGYFMATPGGRDITVAEGRYNEAVLPLRPDVLGEIGDRIAATMTGGGNVRIFNDTGLNSLKGLIRVEVERNNLWQSVDLDGGLVG